MEHLFIFHNMGYLLSMISQSHQKNFSWLKKHLTHEERTLGIHPDYQLLSQIQNIDMHGPCPTDSFANFAELIEYNYPGFRNGTMNIAINYELRKYLTFKAFFDWVLCEIPLFRKFFI